jgi:hypothetical protein
MIREHPAQPGSLAGPDGVVYCMAACVSFHAAADLIALAFHPECRATSAIGASLGLAS